MIKDILTILNASSAGTGAHQITTCVRANLILHIMFVNTLNVYMFVL